MSSRKDNRRKKIIETVENSQLNLGQLKSLLTSSGKSKSKIINKYSKGKIVLFGAISDTHLGSKEERIDALHTFYREARKSGVRDIFHSGDLVCGQGIYAGQEQEIKVFGAYEQAKYVIDNYPREKGVTTHIISGNHDLCGTFYKHAGIDIIGDLIAPKRSDFNYLGHFQADSILGGIRIRLIHPDGGTAYAISYKPQKIAEQIEGGRKPHILLVGHYHRVEYLQHRGIHIFQAGCFESQTPFLLRKGISPRVGGWIIEAKVANDKYHTIVKIKSEHIPFYYNG